MSGSSNLVHGVWFLSLIGNMGKISDGQDLIVFAILPVFQNRLENSIAPSLVPRGRYFLASSINFQFTRLKNF